MGKLLSTSPKLAYWVLSEQQIRIITADSELWGLIPEEQGDETNKSCINLLNVYSHFHPEVTDPQQLLDDTLECIQGIVRRLDGHRARREEQN